MVGGELVGGLDLDSPADEVWVRDGQDESPGRWQRVGNLAGFEMAICVGEKRRKRVVKPKILPQRRLNTPKTRETHLGIGHGVSGFIANIALDNLATLESARVIESGRDKLVGTPIRADGDIARARNDHLKSPEGVG